MPQSNFACVITYPSGYTARSPNRKDYHDALLKKFRERKNATNELCIIRGGYFYEPASRSDFTWGVLDGYPIIAPKMDLPELKPWPFRLVTDDREYTLKQLVASFGASGYAILLSIAGEAACKIPQDFVKAMKEKGSDLEKLQRHGFYAAIIFNSQLVAEKIDNRERVELDYMLPNYKIKIASAAKYPGNPPFMEINDIYFSLNRQGFNAVVLNFGDKEIRRYSFVSDTHENPASTSQ
ncbi:MAG: hypothetical protein ONB46_04830 [candidate division KSB1 bacterium]|nr:hypothetical protein [candidate division KSB1 bacterium]MDZ7365684.1 hypothetical protein [candidate division KSB1 bacterium]MDZ7403240.1 hypothetical protein [candidate division KSB1 bacterium]